MLRVGWRGAWPCARRRGLRGGDGDSSVGHPQGTHCPPGEPSTAPQGAAGGPSEDLGSGCGLAVVASKSPHLKIPFSDALLPQRLVPGGEGLAEVTPPWQPCPQGPGLPVRPSALLRPAPSVPFLGQGLQTHGTYGGGWCSGPPWSPPAGLSSASLTFCHLVHVFRCSPLVPWGFLSRHSQILY